MDGNLSLEQREALASAWTRRGISLLEEPDGALGALPWFEGAIELRNRFPLEENPWSRYGLAAGWLNRGEALSRLGGEERLVESVRCFDVALEHLEKLPVETHEAFRQRRVVAWTNRGVTLMKQGNDRESLRSFQEAQAVLTDEVPGSFFLRAGIWANQATIQFHEGGKDVPIEAEARRILSEVQAEERTDRHAAEIGLKTRQLLCLAIGNQVDAGCFSEEVLPDRVSEVTDIVEAGIRLAQDWKEQGVSEFIPLARVFFCFGLRFYQVHLPHFLTEFLEEFLEGENVQGGIVMDPLLAEAMRDAFRVSEAMIHRRISNLLLTSSDRDLVETLIQRYQEMSRVRDRIEGMIQQRMEMTA